MPDFRPFTLEDAVAAASAVLSDAWGRQVMIEAVRSLGEAERRNIVLRAQAVQDGAAPRSIIIKATRAARHRAS